MIKTSALMRGFYETVFNITPKFRSWYKTIPEEYRLKIRSFLLRRIAASNGDEFNAIPLQGGATLIGYPRAELGMGEHVRLTALSLSTKNFQFSIYDFNQNIVARQGDDRFTNYIDNNIEHPVNIFHINADQMPVVKDATGDVLFKGKYNIGYWAWELSEFPDAWLSSLDMVDEIWAPSKFIQQAIEKKASCPVIWMPLAVQITAPNNIDKKHFGLDPESFVFLFYFDLASFSSRKNPFAIINAFLQAFPKHENKKVQLVIKIMCREWHQSEYDRLQSIISPYSNIILINKVLSHDEIAGLVNVCDCFISLHRSEGFGRGLAEAMLLAKPVIATNYSGNTDFTNDENALLVDYNLIPVAEGEYPFFKGQVWADPNINKAAKYMQQLFEDRKLCLSLGNHAQQYIQKYHSPEYIGERYVNRLNLIYKEVKNEKKS